MVALPTKCDACWCDDCVCADTHIPAPVRDYRPTYATIAAENHHGVHVTSVGNSASRAMADKALTLTAELAPSATGTKVYATATTAHVTLTGAAADLLRAGADLRPFGKDGVAELRLDRGRIRIIQNVRAEDVIAAHRAVGEAA